MIRLRLVGGFPVLQDRSLLLFHIGTVPHTLFKMDMRVLALVFVLQDANDTNAIAGPKWELRRAKVLQESN